MSQVWGVSVWGVSVCGVSVTTLLLRRLPASFGLGFYSSLSLLRFQGPHPSNQLWKPSHRRGLPSPEPQIDGRDSSDLLARLDPLEDRGLGRHLGAVADLEMSRGSGLPA